MATASSVWSGHSSDIVFMSCQQWKYCYWSSHTVTSCNIHNKTIRYQFRNHQCLQ